MAEFHTKVGIAGLDSSFWELVWESYFGVNVIQMQTSESACSIYTSDRKKPAWQAPTPCKGVWEM